MKNKITVLGSFVVDLSCQTEKFPKAGETLIGGPFKMGPGGKGSNQAVAAKRSGDNLNVTFITKVGRDAFGSMAKETYQLESMKTDFVYESEAESTSVALIEVEKSTGQNSIVVALGALMDLTAAEVEKAEAEIKDSKVFLTQFETNMDATKRGLELAKMHGITTVLNTAPVQQVDASIYSGLDYVTPNEHEAEVLTGIKVADESGAEQAADWFLSRGVKNAIITMGEKGVFVKNSEEKAFVESFDIGTATDTTGAGDAFNGGFCAALAEDKGLLESIRFGCATAAICVTRAGTTPAMPSRREVEELMAGKWKKQVA